MDATLFFFPYWKAISTSSLSKRPISVFYSFFSMSGQIIVEWGTSKPADGLFDAMERISKGMAEAGEYRKVVVV